MESFRAMSGSIKALWKEVPPRDSATPAAADDSKEAPPTISADSVDTSKEELEELRADNERLNADNERLNDENKTLRDENKRLSAENERLRLNPLLAFADSLSRCINSQPPAGGVREGSAVPDISGEEQKESRSGGPSKRQRKK